MRIQPSTALLRGNAVKGSSWQCLLTVLCLMWGATLLTAQSAHFSYAQTTVGSAWVQPGGVAADSAGNLFVVSPVSADGGAGTVVKETFAAGSYSATTIGTGWIQPVAVAVAANGAIYVADAGLSQIVMETPVSGSYTQSVAISGLSLPTGVTVDASGNLYVSERGGTILKATLAAGSYTAAPIATGLSQPAALAVDAAGNVFVADQGDGVWKLTPAAGVYTPSSVWTATVADAVSGIAIGADGSLYLAAAGDNQVVVAKPAAGTYTASILASGMNHPQGIALGATGNVYVADTNNNRILRLQTGTVDLGSLAVGATAPASATLVFTFAAAGSQGAAPEVRTQGAVAPSAGPALDYALTSGAPGAACASGVAYAAGASCTVQVSFAPQFPGLVTGAVILRDGNGAAIATARLRGEGLAPQAALGGGVLSTVASGVTGATAIAVDGVGDLFVAAGTTVEELPVGCANSGCAIPLGGGFSNANGIALDGAGNIYVSDTAAGTVAVMPPGCASAACVSPIGGGFNRPMGLAVDANGNVYVADYGDEKIEEIPPACLNASCVLTLSSGGMNPQDVAVDSRGVVVLADTPNDGVEFTSSDSNLGITLPSDGMPGAGYNTPAGVAFTPTDTVVVADTGDGAIKTVAETCQNVACVTTLSGSNGQGLVSPVAVTVDRTGNIYILDSGTHAIDKLSLDQPTPMVFPTPTPAGSVDTADGARATTLTNTGNLPLLLTASSTGTNPSFPRSFPVNYSYPVGLFPHPNNRPATCQAGMQLQQGQVCWMQVNFAPYALGSTAGTSLQVTDNALNAVASDGTGNAVQMIPTLGTGTAPVITMAPATLLPGQQGMSYLQALSAAGSASPYSFALASGALPPGLSLSSAGVLNGILTAAGTFPFTISATDANGFTASQVYTLLVQPPSSTAVPVALVPGEEGSSYLQMLSAAGGVSPYSFALSGGNLPPGLSLSGAGVLNGSLTAAGTFNFTVAVTDAQGLIIANQAYTLLVQPTSTAALGAAPVPMVITVSFPSGGTLSSIDVLTQGANKNPQGNPLDFTAAPGGSCAIGSTYGAGQSCTVAVNFTPQQAGTRPGAVVLRDSSGNALATAYFSAVGQGPQIAFGSGTATTIAPGDAMAVDGSGSVYFSNSSGLVKAPAGCTSPSCQITVASPFPTPTDLAVDGAGNVYASNHTTGVISKIPWLGSGYGAPVQVLNVPQAIGLAVDTRGNIYVSILDSNGTTGTVWEAAWTGDGYAPLFSVVSGTQGLQHPYGVAVDRGGDVFVALNGSQGVLEVPPGCLSATCQSVVASSITRPYGIAIDNAGNLYVANASSLSIVPWNGSSYGAPLPTGIAARANQPAVDAAGNIYSISATHNIMMQDRADAPAVSFASTDLGTTSSDSPHTVTITNLGNQPLHFSAIASAPNWPLLSGASTDCSSSADVPVDTTCSLRVAFTPLAAGAPLSGSLTLTDNSFGLAGTTQSLALSGTAIQLVPSQLVYATLPAVLAAGGNAGTIAVREEDASGHTVPNATDTVTLTVSGPGYAQTYTATAVAGVASFDLSGAALTTAGIYTYTASATSALNGPLTPATATEGVTPVFAGNLGSTEPGQLTTLTFTTSGTVATVAVLTQGVAGKDFTQLPGGTCTTGNAYVAGQQCTVNVAFTAQEPGPRSGAVVAYNATGTALAADFISGNGMGPKVAIGLAANPVVQSTRLAAGLSNPNGMFVDAGGNLYVADSSNNRVLKFAPGCTSTSCALTVGSGLSIPGDVAVDGAGNVFIVDFYHNRIVEVPWTGQGYGPEVTVGGGWFYPFGLTLDSHGDLFVADTNQNQVSELPRTGSGFGTKIVIASGLTAPTGVAVDASGNVFIADNGDGRVVEVPRSGNGYGAPANIMHVTSGFAPQSIKVDAAGNLYIADNDSTSVIELAWTGSGYAAPVKLGSGLNLASGLTLDDAGNVYVSDSGTTGGRVSELNRVSVPALGFSPTAVGATSSDSPQTVSIQNTGNLPLTFSQVTIPAGWTAAAGSTACATAAQVAPGAACTLALSFTPAAPGKPLTGTAIIAENADQSSIAIPLQGIAIGPATQFSIPAPTPVTSGTTGSITITALDAAGNVATSDNGSATLSSSDPGAVFPTNPITFVNGVATASFILKIAGAQNLTLTDTANAALSGSVTVQVLPGPASQLSLNAPSTAVAGTPFTLTVTARDAAGNVAASYAGSLSVTSSDGRASLPAFPVPAGGTGTVQLALRTPGQQTITVTDTTNALLTTATGPILISAPQVLVTTAADDSGTAANCPGAQCSLRDALLFAADAGAANIAFDPRVFAATNAAAQNTITLTAGALALPSYTSVQGPTAGSAATLQNLVTVNANQASSVFTVAAGVTHAALANLTITNGHSATNGGGILNQGELTVTASTLSANTAVADGGGIENQGTLTLTTSTLSGNSAASGGGIDNQSTLTLDASTLSANQATGAGGGLSNEAGSTATITSATFGGNRSAASSGGGLSNAGALTLSGSLLSGDTGGECGAPGVTCPGSGNVAADGSHLAPLGNYGGPTATLLPLPGSAAICAVANPPALPAGATGQRGLPRTAAYGATTCLDAGAVQTHYGVSFVQSPPASTVQYTALTPAPAVQIDESGVPFTAASLTIPLTLNATGAATLSGGSAATIVGTGVATYPALSINAPGSGDTLTASLVLNAALPAPLAITAVSNPFTITPAVTQLAFTTAPAATVTAGGNAGAAIRVAEEAADDSVVTTASDTITLAVTGPNGYSQSYTSPAASGVASFDLSAAALTTAGSYGYTASTGTVTVASATVAVQAAAPASLIAVAGSGQSAIIGAAFASPLAIKVQDRYGNPVDGASVTFQSPATGASATFAPAVATTGSDGVASSDPTANGLAAASAYSVTASTSGIADPVTFTLTNLPHMTTVTVAPPPAALVYGQALTLHAVISPASVLTSTPTGSLRFYEGATALAPDAAVAGAAGSYVVSLPAVGPHVYTAQYLGDTNFGASTASAPTTVTVGRAGTSLSGPAAPVSLVYGAGGSVTVSIAGQFAGANITPPSGSVSYTIGGVAAGTAAIANGAVQLLIPPSQPAGAVAILVSYAGDGNYAPASVTIALSITPASITLTARNASRRYGRPNPVFRGTMSSPVNGDVLTETFTTTATISSNVGNYAIVPGVAGPHAGDYTVVAHNGTLRIRKAFSRTTLQATSPRFNPGHTITLTASVASTTTGTPTGEVIFMDGFRELGRVALDGSGAATLSTTLNGHAGLHLLWAIYQGDMNFRGSAAFLLHWAMPSRTQHEHRGWGGWHHR